MTERRFDLQWIASNPALYRKWAPTWLEGHRFIDRSEFLKTARENLERIRQMYAASGALDEHRGLCATLMALQSEFRKEATAIARPQCGQCKGWCCGWHMGNGHLRDPIDLLLFGLGGVELETYMSNEGRGCCFLGADGCSLPPNARPRVCVMYFCSRIATDSYRGLASYRRLVKFYAGCRHLFALGTKVMFDEVCNSLQTLPWFSDLDITYNSVRGELSGKNARYFTFLRFKPELEQIVFTFVYPFSVPVDIRRGACDLLCRLNRGVALGCFEQDLSDGEIRFRTSMCVNEGPFHRPQFYRLLEESACVVDAHFPSFMALLHGEMSASEAIKQCDRREFEAFDDDADRESSFTYNRAQGGRVREEPLGFSPFQLPAARDANRTAGRPEEA